MCDDVILNFEKFVITRICCTKNMCDEWWWMFGVSVWEIVIYLGAAIKTMEEEEEDCPFIITWCVQRPFVLGRSLRLTFNRKERLKKKDSIT